MTAASTGRIRDPARKERILSAAADLVARHGFTAVSMEDIGDAVGITASAIYRHYDSKSAVLVAMLDRVVDKLLSDAQAIASGGLADPRAALARLIEGYIDFVINDRDAAQVYFREVAQVPPDDRRRLTPQPAVVRRGVGAAAHRDAPGHRRPDGTRAGARRDRRHAVHPLVLGRAAGGPAARPAAGRGAAGAHPHPFTAKEA